MSRFIELQQITGGIRKLFISLSEKLNKTQDKVSSFTGAFHSLTEINNLNSIDLFKSFLDQHGYNWPEIRKTIKMLKSNRITIVHPGDENTNNKDIEDAINECFPDVSSVSHQNNANLETFTIASCRITRAIIYSKRK